MSIKIICWTDLGAVKIELAKKLAYAKRAKMELIEQWDRADKTCYSLQPNKPYFSGSLGTDGVQTVMMTPTGQATPNVSMTYAYKNLRFIHAQLCANPPVAAPRPTNGTIKSKQSADLCDKTIRYGQRQYKMQERIEIGTLNTLQYGTGIWKTQWNRELGDILSVDETTGECIMEGDFELTVVNSRYFFADPDADHFDKSRWCFQEYALPYDEACYKFGKEIADRMKDNARQKMGIGNTNKEDIITVYEYWETGLPQNGFQGRYVICEPDGTPIIPPSPSPYQFGKGGKRKKAMLPYHMLTDIDIPNSLWGKSFLDYTVPIQDNLNELDTNMLDALSAHAVYRMAVPDGCELDANQPSTDNWEVVRYKGNRDPHFLPPPAMPPDLSRTRQQMVEAIDDLSGVNESMFGKQSRETSGFLGQYNVNQGSMIRRRLLNKYAAVVESIYKHYLLIVTDKWKTQKQIAVVGKEKAMETVSLIGMDLADGFELIVEYGTNLSLDPISRREEIMQLQPLFKEAGISTMTSLKLMRLNDLEGHFDIMELSENRQREYIDMMIVSGTYVPPEPYELHAAMLEYAIKFRMSAEFKPLPKPTRDNILRHITERSKMDAEEKKLLAPAEATPAAAPAAAPAGADPLAAMAAAIGPGQ